MHEKLVAQYEKIVPNEPFYRMYQEDYLELVGENPLKCYKQLKCLIEIGALHFSKFFNIWDNESIIRHGRLLFPALQRESLK